MILFYGEEFLAPRPTPPKLRTTPRWLSATAYSIYSQLPFILEAVPNLRTRHAVVTRTHLSRVNAMQIAKLY